MADERELGSYLIFIGSEIILLLFHYAVKSKPETVRKHQAPSESKYVKSLKFYLF